MEQAGSRRVLRWVIWLGVAAVVSIGLGFAVGLARPRAQTPRIEQI